MQSKSDHDIELAQSPGVQLVRGCVSLMLVLIQSSKQAQKIADVSNAIAEGLQSLQSRTKNTSPYFTEITESIAALKSKLSLQIE